MMRLKLTILLFVASFSVFAKEGDNLAFEKGAITLMLGTATPNYLRFVTDITGGSTSGPIQIGGQYQLGKRLSLGVQYSFVCHSFHQAVV